MGQKISIPSQNQPFRRQSSLGGNVSFRNVSGNEDNSFVTLARVTKVYYKQGKIDFKLTNTNIVAEDSTNDGSGSAPIPVDFFGKRANGQVFGHYRPIKIGDLIAVAYLNGHKTSPIVIGVYPTSSPDYEIISPSFYDAGNDEDDSVAETGLAEEKVYPSMQTEYRSGSGTIAKALNGHSFLTIDDETTNQYSQLWASYDNVGFFSHNGEITNPLKEKAGDWLLVHEDNPNANGNGHRTRFYVNQDGNVQIVLMGNDSAGNISVFEGSRENGFSIKHYQGIKSIKSGDLGQDVYSPDFDSATKYVEMNIGKDESVLLQALDGNKNTNFSVKPDGVYVNGKSISEIVYNAGNKNDQKISDITKDIDDINQHLADKDKSDAQKDQDLQKRWADFDQKVQDNAKAASDAAKSAERAGDDAKEAGQAAVRAGDSAVSLTDDIKNKIIYYSSISKEKDVHIPGKYLIINTDTYIANGTIKTAYIEDGAISSAKIGNEAVGTAQIAKAAVGTLQVADGAIGTAQIKDLAVTDEKVGNLTFNHMIGQTLDANKIKVKNISGDEISADTITANHLKIGKLSEISGDLGNIIKGRISAGDDPNKGVVIDGLDADDPDKYTASKKAALFREVNALNASYQATLAYAQSVGIDATALQQAQQAMSDGLSPLFMNMGETTTMNHNKVVELEKALQQAISDIQNQFRYQLGTTANGKSTIYSGSQQPAHPKENDLWMKDTGSGTDIEIYNGAGWVSPSLNVVNNLNAALRNMPKTFFQSAQPDPKTTQLNEGDLWYKLTKDSNGNFVYTYYKWDNSVHMWVKLLNNGEVTNQSSIKQLQSNLEQTQEGVDSATSAIQQVSSNASSDAAKIRADVAKIQNEVDTNKSATSASVDKLKSDIGSAQIDLNRVRDSLAKAQSAVQGDMTALQRDVSGIKLTISDHDNNIHTLQADSKALEDDMADAKDNISSLQKTSTSLTSEMQGYGGRLSKVEQTANGTQQTVTNQQDQINTIKTDASGIHETLTGQGNQIANINVTLNGLNTKYDGVSGDLNKLKDSNQWKTVTGAFDANQYTQTARIFYQDTQAKNTPNPGWFYLMVEAPETNRITQKLIKDNNYDSWSRFYNGKWSAWTKGTTQLDIDSLSNRITTNSTQIIQNKQAIALKANQSTVDSLSGEVSQAQAQLKVQADQISSKVSSTDFKTLNDKVNGMQIGTSNLLHHSDTFDGWSRQSTVTISSEKYLNGNIAVLASNGSGVNNLSSSLDGPYDDQPVTWTVWAKADNAGDRLHTELWGGGGFTDQPLTTNWKLYKFTGHRNINHHDLFFWGVAGNKGNIYIALPFAVVGNTIGTWSPNPSDTITAIQKNSTAIDQTNKEISLKADQTEVDEIKGTASQNSSRLDTMANEIQSKVTSTDVNNIVDSKGYATTRTVQSLITQKADTINESIVKLDRSVKTGADNNVQLVRKSDFEDGDKGGWDAQTVVTTDPPAELGQSGMKVLQTNARDDYEEGIWYSVKPGENFDVDFWCKPSTSYNSNFGLVFADKNKGNYTWRGVFVNKSNQWKHYTGTITAPVNASFAKPWIQIDKDASNTTDTALLAKPSIRRQNATTVAAIQQITASIDGLQSTVAKKDDVASMISQKADSIEAGITGKLSSLNYGGLVLDKNGATLTSGNTHIYLNGTHGFQIQKGTSDIFHVDTDGNLTIKGDSVVGNISGVNFTGANLNLAGSMKVSGSILAGDDGKGNAKVVINNDGLNMTSGDINLGDDKGTHVHIANDGTLTANQANISGNITATKLLLNDPTGNGQSLINLGGKFMVDSQGNVTANTFKSENVTVTGGEIKGTTIDGNHIKGGTIHGTTIDAYSTINGATINGVTINGTTFNNTIRTPTISGDFIKDKYNDFGGIDDRPIYQVNNAGNTLWHLSTAKVPIVKKHISSNKIEFISNSTNWANPSSFSVGSSSSLASYNKLGELRINKGTSVGDIIQVTGTVNNFSAKFDYYFVISKPGIDLDNLYDEDPNKLDNRDGVVVGSLLHSVQGKGNQINFDDTLVVDLETFNTTSLNLGIVVSFKSSSGGLQYISNTLILDNIGYSFSSGTDLWGLDRSTALTTSELIINPTGSIHLSKETGLNQNDVVDGILADVDNYSLTIQPTGLLLKENSTYQSSNSAIDIKPSGIHFSGNERNMNDAKIFFGGINENSGIYMDSYGNIHGEDHSAYWRIYNKSDNSLVDFPMNENYPITFNKRVILHTGGESDITTTWVAASSLFNGAHLPAIGRSDWWNIGAQSGMIAISNGSMYYFSGHRYWNFTWGPSDNSSSWGTGSD